MAKTYFIVALICIASVAAVPSYPAYLIPEHRSELRPLKALEEIPMPVPINSYEYQLIPADEYAMAEYDSVIAPSVFDIISNPISAVTSLIKSVVSGIFGLVSKVAIKALSIGKWIIINGGLVFLGMALVVGFCAFTPFCTLIIEKPFAREIRALNIPYLDDMEYYLNQAYDKYQEMQKSL